jgi:trigger factor
LPELTEEFAKKVGGPEMTIETLRVEVADGLRRRREQAREVTKSNQVLEHLSTKIEFELPQEVVNRAAQRRTNDIAQRAMRQGVSADELVNQQEAILNSATQQARQDVKISFILEEVAKAEKLEVEERQLQMALAQMAGRSQMPIKKFLAKAQKDGTIENLRNDLLLQNALEFLKDNAVIEDIDPEPEHCETHSPAASA